jgi:alpha-1,6-mannosyltransferase
MVHRSIGRLSPSDVLLVILGVASLLPYLAARGLFDLRASTVGFEIAFWGAFALYLAAAALVVRQKVTSKWRVAGVFAFAMVFRLALLPTWPTLSDDMFRYVWDGRVQGHGLSPYHYPPDAPQVASLHVGDQTVWPNINRKPYVTVYPPGAQAAFAVLWRVVGDSVTGFKAGMVLAELLGGVLLLGLLRWLGQPGERVLIYLWSPLLVFEVAQAGHVDGLMLLFLIAAFWARVSDRPWVLGFCLGAATLVKLFPVLLLPALLPLPRPFSWKGLRVSAQMLLGFGGIMVLGYVPYLLGGGALGFLPNYFGENFNLGLARGLFDLAPYLRLQPAALANAVTFGGVVVIGGLCLWRPAQNGREALRRGVWLIGWFTLFTQNLFAWYLLWLIPLLVVELDPGRWLGFKLSAGAAWLIYTGTVALSYLFFIHWTVIDAAQIAEYAPLYALLLAVAAARAWRRVSLKCGL